MARSIRFWRRKRNWLHETRNQELFRRVNALEVSLREAHLRINAQDQQISGLALLFGQKTVHPGNLSGPLSGPGQ